MNKERNANLQVRSEFNEGSDFGMQLHNFIKRANQDLEEFVKDLILVESTGSSCLNSETYEVWITKPSMLNSP